MHLLGALACMRHVGGRGVSHLLSMPRHLNTLRLAAAIITASAAFATAPHSGGSAGSSGSAGWPAPARLRVEGLVQQQQPDRGLVVLSEKLPRFSFSHGLGPGTPSSPRGLAQVAYRITVRQSTGRILWDSGTVHTDNSSDILYAGDDPLEAFGAYTWTASWLATGKYGSCP